jgi:uncharacterized damage-inducible protein DinB
MNQMLLERLDERAWCAKPPGGKARTIAAIFAHMHNVRRKWLRLSAPHLPLPSALDRAHCTPKQARSALAESAARCGEMLAEAIEAAAGPAKEFRFLRDGWAKAWPGGAAMFTYMVVHDAHHRGQVCMLARQLGYPLNKGYEIWAWEKIWRELRLRGPR